VIILIFMIFLFSSYRTVSLSYRTWCGIPEIKRDTAASNHKNHTNHIKITVQTNRLPRLTVRNDNEKNAKTVEEYFQVELVYNKIVSLW